MTGKPRIDKKGVKLKRIYVDVPAHVHEAYYRTCANLFNRDHKGDTPLRNFIHNFIRENNKDTKIK